MATPYDDLLALALGVAVEAGELLLRRPDDLGVDTKSSATDVVTVMDRASEELVVGRLLDGRPGDALLAEEGAERSGTSGVRWVVDPLDGTVNYLHRLPFWAVSIAAESRGEVVAGVVHAPVLGWTFTATRGGGAWQGQEQLRGSSCTELSRALVATGFAYDATRRGQQGAVAAAVLPRVADLRRCGSGALDLCMAAWGVVDASYERGLSPWDHAAGGLVASEAGLLVTGLQGAAAGWAMTVAAPPALAPDLLKLLTELDATHEGQRAPGPEEQAGSRQ